jgi:hypothetical protein
MLLAGQKDSDIQRGVSTLRCRRHAPRLPGFPVRKRAGQAGWPSAGGSMRQPIRMKGVVSWFEGGEGVWSRLNVTDR